MENPNFNQTGLFKNLTYFVYLLGAFALPLIFIPGFASSFQLPKWAIVAAVTLLGLLFWGLDCFFNKEVRLKLPPLTKPFAALAGVFILATLVTSSNHVAPFYDITGLILALTLFYIIGSTMLGKRIKHLFWALLGSSFLLSWIAVFAYLELLPKIFPALAFTADKRFTPAGGPLVLISFLAVMAPVTVVLGLKKKESLTKLLLFVVSAVQAVALILTVSLILPGQSRALPLALLPYSAGWSITVDQFKTLKTALLGTGPGDFISAFNRFRPVGLNLTDFWNVRFGSSSNEIFMITTTTGILGLISLGWIYYSLIRLLRQGRAYLSNIGLGLGLILILILFFLIPANIILLFTFFAFAAGLGIGKEEVLVLKTPLKKITGLVFLVVILVVVGAAGFLSRQVVAAEQAYGLSLKAVRENNGGMAYNQLLKAQRRNPFDLRYRLEYANLNLILANNLAGKADITEDERQTILQLVSQAIRDGKSGVALAPENAAAWENLANIYRQLFNFAQGAEQWAISAYVQAVRLDPTNPRLRVNLGGLLFTLRSFDDAIDQFKRAIDLKPDYANAFYNLSWAYREKGDLILSYNAMQNTVNLVDRDTVDFDTATTELQKLWELLPDEVKTATSAAQKQPGELEKPQTYPSPRPAGRLPINNQQLREDLEPAVPEISEEEKTEEELPVPEEVLAPKPSPSPAM